MGRPSQSDVVSSLIWITDSLHPTQSLGLSDRLETSRDEETGLVRWKNLSHNFSYSSLAREVREQRE